MDSTRILWVDDEVELLKPHFLFLEERGYHLTPCKSGQDALELLKREIFQVIMLDENMPGLSGIETLNEIKTLLPNPADRRASLNTIEKLPLKVEVCIWTCPCVLTSCNGFLWGKGLSEGSLDCDEPLC